LNQSANIFNQIVEDRRSMRVYHPDAPFDEEAVSRSLHRATLAPNSSNLQVWEFYRIKSEEMKTKVVKLCLNQSAARTARELIVVVCRADKWKDHSQRLLESIRHSFSDPLTKKDKRAVQYYQLYIPLIYRVDPFGIMTLIRKGFSAFQRINKPFAVLGGNAMSRIMAHKSAALAAQTFMLSMKAEGYDTCPMEGFDEKRLKKLLQLPRRAEINMVISTGVGTPKGIYSERFRFPEEEIIYEL
jgi:nitroreductase